MTSSTAAQHRRRVSAPALSVPLSPPNYKSKPDMLSPGKSPSMVTSFPLVRGTPHANTSTVTSPTYSMPSGSNHSPHISIPNLGMAQPELTRRTIEFQPMMSPGVHTASPVVQKGKPMGRSSLVGFDPLLPIENTPAHKRASDPPASPLAHLSMQSPNSAVHSGNTQNRCGVQSFGVKDLTVIPTLAQSRNSTPSPTGMESRTPNTPPRSPEVKNRTGHSRSPAGKKKDPSPPRKSPVPEKTSKPLSLSEHKRASGVSPKIRQLPWNLGKTHRKTKSLEMESPPKGMLKVQKDQKLNAAMDRDSAINSSFVKDMMDVRFEKLQIPALAKPSPTSFLTGSEVADIRTSEFEAAPFQTELPGLDELLVAARINEFVENYRRLDQNFDLQSWAGHTHMDLRQVSIKEHIPIANLLLGCGDGVCLRGVVSKGTSPDDCVEAVVFEDQRHFIAVFRGPTELQMKPGSSKHKKKTAPLDPKQPSIEVFQCFLEEYMKVEKECFALLDKLLESEPFCEIMFTGHSFGAALATLASFRYANARPTSRVKCYPMSSPKVGLALFRQQVNSTPNLKVVRLQYGQDGKSQLPSPAGSHVGHTLALHGSLGNNSQKIKHPVLAYKFDAPKQKKFKTTHPDLRSYVAALEEIARCKMQWVQDYVGTSGKGVVVNNEARQMV